MPAWCSRSIEHLEAVGVAEARVGREVGRDVVAPRAAERVLHHRHQLDVGEAEVGEVGHERVGDLVPVVEVARVVLAPRGEVHLVDRHRLVHRRLLGAGGEPGVVVPHVGRRPRRSRRTAAASRRSGPSGRRGRPRPPSAPRMRNLYCAPMPMPGTCALQMPESPTRASGAASRPSRPTRRPPGPRARWVPTPGRTRRPVQWSRPARRAPSTAPRAGPRG